MSEFIIRKGFTNEVQRNTPIQKRNDQNIQKWLNCYKYYEEKEEFKQNTGKDFDLIISHRPTIPDLVIFNKPFNKNNCFCEANPDEINSFPRKKLFIKFDKKDKEQLKKYNLKKNKEYRFNSKKNNPNEMKIKENYNKKKKENIENIKKEEENKNEKEENEEEVEEEGEGEEDDDDDDGEDDEESEEKNNDEEDEKEKEKENDSKQDEKKEDLEGEENFEEKKNNENNNSSEEKINDKLNFSKPITSFFPKNNNNISNISNQNFGFMNNENCSTTSNTNNINNSSQSKMNLNNDNSSILEEISYEGSIYNNINNLVDSKSVSQYGNESFSMNPNLQNNANNVNNNIGFNNNINNNLIQNLLNQSQINNNNQFSNFTNNIPFGLIGNNPLNIYNASLNLQNNLNLHISLLTQYTFKYWKVRGWLLTFIKEGKKINRFTSFELFSFLNQKIIDNVKIDDYLITTENKEQQFTGGIVYVSFINIFPNVFNILKEESIKQIGLNNLLLKSNNNNFGISNANVLNNLNNNNFLMNNFNNNNFNFS